MLIACNAAQEFVHQRRLSNPGPPLKEHNLAVARIERAEAPAKQLQLARPTNEMILPV
jgi:hypothetical protein